MVCEKCQKKVGKLAAPNPWKTDNEKRKVLFSSWNVNFLRFNPNLILNFSVEFMCAGGRE